ncbi:MAG: DUF2271 domain-containing protein [Acidimicrobiales bacterium]|nr:DUF2271 domain-containing protein [Acidimicrobiales bacterium]
MTPSPDRSDPIRRLRYVAVSRRAWLARGASAATAAAILGLAACGNSDAGTLADAQSTTTAAAASDASTTTSAAAADEATTTSEAATGEALTGEVVVDLTYSSDGGGQVHNPYLAVWVEDADGNLVTTLAVWYEQSDKGSRWLNDLSAWVAADGSSETLQAVSGATRTAGDQSLIWDLTDLDGDPVPAGTYVINIESAREHGPHSLISQEVVLDSSSTTVSLDPDGELTDATVTHTAG